MRILNDPTCRAGGLAGLRTLANTSIAMVDFIPALGDSFSWGADIFKIARHWAMSRGTDPKFLDLTPDVSLGIALKTEGFEVLCGVPATHFIEGGIQAKHDLPRIKTGLRRAMQHWRGEVVREVTDYRTNQPSVDAAIRTFDGSAPSAKGVNDRPPQRPSGPTKPPL